MILDSQIWAGFITPLGIPCMGETSNVGILTLVDIVGVAVSVSRGFKHLKGLRRPFVVMIVTAIAQAAGRRGSRTTGSLDYREL